MTLGVGACHEVLGIEPPPLDRSEAVLVAAEGPGGRLTLFATTPDLTAPPNLVLEADGEVWALGYGCELERLGLSSGPLDLSDRAELPTLPVPAEAWVWQSRTGWRSGRAEDAPERLRDLLPSDGIEPCASFVSRLTEEPPRLNGFDIDPPRLGSPFLTAVANGAGGILVLQPLFVPDEDEETRSLVGGRLLEADEVRETARLRDKPAALSEIVGLASRGQGRLVIAGFETAVQGRLDDTFTPLPVFPDLRGNDAVTMVVSPHDEPLEVFVLARSEEPASSVRTSTLTLYRVDEERVDVLAVQTVARLFRGGPPRPDALVRTGPGEVYALGYSASGQILHARPGRVELEDIDPARAREPVGLGYHPEVGVVVTDREGSTFWRPLDQPDGSPWRRLGTRRNDFGPLLVTIVEGFATFGLYGAEQRELRLVHVQDVGPPPRVCATAGLSVPPLIDLTFEAADFSAVVDSSGRGWWIASARGGDLRLSRVILEGGLGRCGGGPR